MRRKDLGGVATLTLEPPNVPARIWLLSDESANKISNSRCNALRWTSVLSEATFHSMLQSKKAHNQRTHLTSPMSKDCRQEQLLQSM